MNKDYLEQINIAVLAEHQPALTEELSTRFVDAFTPAMRARFRELMAAAIGEGGPTSRALETECEKQAAREVLPGVAERVFAGLWTSSLRVRVGERLIRWRLGRNWV